MKLQIDIEIDDRYFRNKEILIAYIDMCLKTAIIMSIDAPFKMEIKEK